MDSHKFKWHYFNNAYRKTLKGVTLMEKERKVIGVMDPNYYAFLVTLERLIAHACPSTVYNGKEYEIATKRMKCHPYDVLNAWTETSH